MTPELSAITEKKGVLLWNNPSMLCEYALFSLDNKKLTCQQPDRKLVRKAKLRKMGRSREESESHQQRQREQEEYNMMRKGTRPYGKA